MKKIILASVIASVFTAPAMAQDVTLDFSNGPEAHQTVRIINQDGKTFDAATDEYARSIEERAIAADWRGIHAQDTANANTTKLSRVNTKVIDNKAEIEVMKDDMTAERAASQRVDNNQWNAIADQTKRIAREEQESLSRDNDMIRRYDETRTTDLKRQHSIDASQDTRIDNNSQRIDKNEQDIMRLDDKVDQGFERIDRGLAAVTAMNGLVRPYGVGNVAVTAAVGTYNSKEALAIGVGYRVTEQLTVQGSLATGFDDYQPAANVGVGYEF